MDLDVSASEATLIVFLIGRFDLIEEGLLVFQLNLRGSGREMNASDEEKNEAKQIAFHMVKGPGYQTYHADGAIGGITPQGKVFVSFYVERGAIPQTIYHEIDDQGRLGAEIATEGKSGIVREMTCGLIIDIRTARGLREWLGKLLEDQEQKQ